MLKKFFVFIFFFLFCIQIRGVILYVSVAYGNDTNNGLSPNSPLKTIAQASKLAIPGTTILISPGVYRETITPKSGTPQNPIVYKALKTRANEQVIIRGADLVGGFSSYKGTNPQFSDDKVYVAPLNGWTFTTPHDDGSTDMKTSVTYVASSTNKKLNSSERYFLARSPNPKVKTDWKRAEYFWRADGGGSPGTFSTTQLTDVTDDIEPVDAQKGNLRTIGVNLAGASLFALDSKDSHWFWYRIIKNHNLVDNFRN